MKCIECETNDAMHGLFCYECRGKMKKADDEETNSTATDIFIAIIGIVCVVVFGIVGFISGCGCGT